MEYGLDLFCPSVSSLYGNGMERMLLRAFGAKIAPTAMVYATAHVFQPWLLIMDDYACLAEG